ncbi:hypothetical protein P43SY_010983 [Pythium insidiosum]|uniref:FYVE-type domain-containing protein n=1 Tax=Pythium insidiosum TaxID=114742 RepID=A0AAD5LHN0_PYTIN|nr:hypothetical protein P43SY_010983 [Pythium insidiosum]
MSSSVELYPTPEQRGRRSSDSSSSSLPGTATMTAAAHAAGWPTDVDLDAWYDAERAELDETIRDALDLSVWSLEGKKDATSIYVHCKNNEKLSFSVRAVARVTGTVANVLECLRSPDSASYRALTKRFHSRVFLDSEVLHAHVAGNRNAESMALKWVALATGKKTIGRGKEFCVREYCTIRRQHPQHGTVGVLKFVSYDGVGARYGIRSRQEAYSLTVFEPSSIVVCPTPEEGILSVTMTVSMRKARGSNSVSSGVKSLSMRLAHDLAALQRTVQHLLFQPETLADKKEWVADKERSNCFLCMQSFNMLKRRHHCRVCGEVVCSACSVVKTVATRQNNHGSSDTEPSSSGSAPSKIRACKQCLSKSSTTESTPPSRGNNQKDTFHYSPLASFHTTSSLTTSSASPYAHQAPMSMPNFKNITLSVVSTSSGTSTSSDDSQRSGDENEPTASLHSLQSFKQSLYNKMSTGSGSGSISSFGDLEASGPVAPGFSPRSHGSSIASTVTLASTAQPSSVHVPVLDGAGGHHLLTTASSGRLKMDKRTHYFNDDFEEICMLAMETLGCAMAGIRTDDFELVNYLGGVHHPDLPRSLPTFRRIASRGKPCIVLDVSADKRIAGEKRSAAKLQFFVGIPLILDGDVIGDLCVADRFPRDSIEQKAVDVLLVLGKTVTQYMTSQNYQEDLLHFRAHARRGGLPLTSHHSSQPLDDTDDDELAYPSSSDSHLGAAAAPATVKEVAF